MPLLIPIPKAVAEQLKTVQLEERLLETTYKCLDALLDAEGVKLGYLVSEGHVQRFQGTTKVTKSLEWMYFSPELDAALLIYRIDDPTEFELSFPKLTPSATDSLRS